MSKKTLLILIAAALAVCAVALVAVLKKDSVIPGWHGEDERKSYVVFPFARASGQYTIGGEIYSFEEYGEHLLLKGWHVVDDKKYWSDPQTGIVARGDFRADGQDYHSDPDTGRYYAEGVYIIDGKLWYYDDHGFRRSGIVKIDGNYFCFSEKGNLLKGLQQIDGKYYYFDPQSEAMVFGLKTVNGATYYFGEDGAAVTGEYEIDGQISVFGPDGKKIN